MRKIAKTLLVSLGIVVVIEAVATAFRIWAWRSRNPRALRLIKRFNKYVENPVQLRFSAQSGPSAVVHHRGRRSGTPYATPVIAHQTHHDVIIPLPYGTEVDWLRNLLAAGQAVVDLEGHSLGVEEPVVVDINDVIDLLSAPMVRIVRFNRTREALRLRVSEPTSADLEEENAFWAGVLGGAVDRDDDWHMVIVDGEPRVGVKHAPDHVPPDWPHGSPPQQVHLDLWVDDFPAAHERVMALGARVLQPAASANEGDDFQVYADPAGHPFCLCFMAGGAPLPDRFTAT